MIQTAKTNIHEEDLWPFPCEVSEYLITKRGKLVAFLQMSGSELQPNPEYIRFLVCTNRELIEKAITLSRVKAGHYPGEFNNMAKELSGMGSGNS